MKPTEISSRGCQLHEELFQLDLLTEALAAAIVREGIPSDWTFREKGEAHLLFLKILDSLTRLDRPNPRCETLRAAIRVIVASNSRNHTLG